MIKKLMRIHHFRQFYFFQLASWVMIQTYGFPVVHYPQVPDLVSSDWCTGLSLHYLPLLIFPQFQKCFCVKKVMFYVEFLHAFVDGPLVRTKELSLWGSKSWCSYTVDGPKRWLILIEIQSWV